MASIIPAAIVILSLTGTRLVEQANAAPIKRQDIVVEDSFADALQIWKAPVKPPDINADVEGPPGEEAATASEALDPAEESASDPAEQDPAADKSLQADPSSTLLPTPSEVGEANPTSSVADPAATDTTEQQPDNDANATEEEQSDLPEPTAGIVQESDSSNDSTNANSEQNQIESPPEPASSEEDSDKQSGQGAAQTPTDEDGEPATKTLNLPGAKVTEGPMQRPSSDSNDEGSTDSLEAAEEEAFKSRINTYINDPNTHVDVDQQGDDDDNFFPWPNDTDDPDNPNSDPDIDPSDFPDYIGGDIGSNDSNTSKANWIQIGLPDPDDPKLSGLKALSEENQKKLKLGVGISLGVVGLLVLLYFLFRCVKARRKNRPREEKPQRRTRGGAVPERGPNLGRKPDGRPDEPHNKKDPHTLKWLNSVPDGHSPPPDRHPSSDHGGKDDPRRPERKGGLKSLFGRQKKPVNSPNQTVSSSKSERARSAARALKGSRAAQTVRNRWREGSKRAVSGSQRSVSSVKSGVARKLFSGASRSTESRRGGSRRGRR